MQVSQANHFGEYIYAHWYYFDIYQKSDKNGQSPHKLARLYTTSEIFMDYFQCLDVSLAHHPHSKGLLLH